MPNTALITGATGLLGRAVAKEFATRGWKAVGTGLSRASPPSTVKLDLLNSEDIERVLDEIKPDVVVHCAANRFPDSCNADPAAAIALNATASHTLTSLASRRSIFLLYISTDYVFSGLPGEAPYLPSSTPAPPNMYGQTKLEGEKAVLTAAADSGNRGTGLPLAAVLRVPILYGSCSNPAESAINVLVQQIQKAVALKADEPRIQMDDYAQRFPTNIADVARVCFDICALYRGLISPAAGFGSSRLPGILHFSSEDKMTKYDICEILAEVLGVTLDGMEKFKPPEDEGEGKVKRPYDCHLDTKETRELGIDLQTVDFKGWWRQELASKQ
ncbi:uncharacterized protein K452DRAFT_253000 [Aplosporella prunicola CBS 121167]|uniref:RmlD-like substrate binding domain-containing protein n=1 Tax=Aplosporella prunicola CBS 121167 TaxID=1176127 RepID=A0A6A6B9N5_9PEZI|nr:uncharacterized protein K452DRAFT_253000 [Aplosporella prunicola CBS 121167]KAF2140278.1 hypothetical protein K452DRAFT_253000 [Aplosporella prunicola CBS 121167]